LLFGGFAVTGIVFAIEWSLGYKKRIQKTVQQNAANIDRSHWTKSSIEVKDIGHIGVGDRSVF
jgi:hypothetical protein